MQLVFSVHAWEEYLHWLRTDPALAQRINLLFAAARRSPAEGLGKPEPLKHTLQGYWSRRIDGQHRMLYRVVNDQIWIVQLRYHY